MNLHLQLRRTRPGIPANVIWGGHSKNPVDAYNPFAKQPLRNIQKIVPPVTARPFVLTAYPVGVMDRFDDYKYMRKVRQRGISTEFDELVTTYTSGIKYLPPQPHLPASGDSRRKKHTIPMAVVITVPKTVHKSAVLRNRLKSKLKEALRFVVILGARASGKAGEKIGFDTVEGIPEDNKEDALVVQGLHFPFS